MENEKWLRVRHIEMSKQRGSSNKLGDGLAEDGWIWQEARRTYFTKRIRTSRISFQELPETGSLYVDMGGTNEVPNWESTCPLLYFFRKEGIVSDDDQRIILKTEFMPLKNSGCPTRFSFMEVSEPEGLFFGDDDVSDFCPE